MAYDRSNRIGHYPLMEWGWGRSECLAYVCERGPSYPTREDYYVVAPAVVETKARYGVSRFDQQ